MSKPLYFRQCHLQKPTKSCVWEQTSWLPEQFAILNKVLKLRSNGDWDNGWIVRSVSTKRLSEDLLPDSHIEIKEHRRATGDSMKKR